MPLVRNLLNIKSPEAKMALRAYDSLQTPLRFLTVGVTALIASFFTVAAQAGPGLSGGGQGVVCRSPDGKVVSAELLDLAEAREYFVLEAKIHPDSESYLAIASQYADMLDSSIPTAEPAIRWSTSINGQLKASGYDLNPGILLSKNQKSRAVWDSVNRIDKEKLLIPGDNFKMIAIEDSHPRVAPSSAGCGIEQIATFSDGDGKIRIIGNVWVKLDTVNKAALLIHEALYQSLRQDGEDSSDRTRKTVGYIFSGMQFQWILDGLPNRFLMCWTTDPAHQFRFAVYPGDADLVNVLFLQYAGEMMLTKTSAVFPAASFASYLGVRSGPVNNAWVARDLNNPLLDLPGYNFAIEVNSSTGIVVSSLEAIQLTAGPHLVPISCNSGLTTVTVGKDSIGTSTKH